jgi:hypothetical protein
MSGGTIRKRSRHASTVCTSGCTIASARVLRYRPGNHGHYLRQRDGRKCPVGKNEGCEETWTNWSAIRGSEFELGPCGVMLFSRKNLQPTIQPTVVDLFSDLRGFGSPRSLVSCKTYNRAAVTAEVASSSLVVPAILFSKLVGLPRCTSVEQSFQQIHSTERTFRYIFDVVPGRGRKVRVA